MYERKKFDSADAAAAEVQRWLERHLPARKISLVMRIGPCCCVDETGPPAALDISGALAELEAEMGLLVVGAADTFFCELTAPASGPFSLTANTRAAKELCVHEIGAGGGLAMFFKLTPNPGEIAVLAVPRRIAEILGPAFPDFADNDGAPEVPRVAISWADV